MLGCKFVAPIWFSKCTCAFWAANKATCGGNRVSRCNSPHSCPDRAQVIPPRGCEGVTALPRSGEWAGLGDEKNYIAGLATQKGAGGTFLQTVSPKVRVLKCGYAARTKRHTTATGAKRNQRQPVSTHPPDGGRAYLLAR